MSTQETEPPIPDQMYHLWQLIDNTCGKMGWRWTKVRRGTSVCLIECIAPGGTGSYISILFNANEEVDPNFRTNPKLSEHDISFSQSASDEVDMFVQALRRELRKLSSSFWFLRRRKPLVFKNLDPYRKREVYINRPMLDSLGVSNNPITGKLPDLPKFDVSNLLAGIRYPLPIYPKLSPVDLDAIAKILAKKSDFQTPDTRRTFLEIAGVYHYIELDLNGSSGSVAQRALLRINERGYIGSNQLALELLLEYLAQDETLPIVDKRLIQKHLHFLRADSGKQGP